MNVLILAHLHTGTDNTFKRVVQVATHPVSGGHGLCKVVGRHDEGGALGCQSTKQLGEHLLGGHVDAGERFVKEQH